MNDFETAKKISSILDQNSRSSRMESKDLDPETATLLDIASTLRSSMTPQRHQETRVRKRIEKIALAASPENARKQIRRYQMKRAVYFSLISLLFVVLTFGLFWLFHELTSKPVQQDPVPAVVTEVEETRKEDEDQDSLTEEQQDTPVPETVPASQSLVPDACQFSFADTGLNQDYFFYDRPEAFVGGGVVSTDGFSFHLWLVCGSNFKRSAVIGEQPSDIDGLGILTFWEYHGSMPDGILRDYVGFEPFVNENSGMGGPFDDQSSINMTSVNGFSVGPGVIPDFSQQDTVMRYVLFTEMPNGERSGAALSFTLQREEQGYRPVDIQVTALDADELVGIENQPHTNLPYALKVDDVEMPALDPILKLVEAWQNEFISSPGWYYRLDQNFDPDGNGLVAGMQSFQQEMWQHINEDGFVDQMVVLDTASDGWVVQQSVSTNGLSRNLTYAMENPFQPYRYDEAVWLREHFIPVVKAGWDIIPVRTTWQDHEVWMIDIMDEFATPQQVDNHTAIATGQRTYIASDSGQPLGSETYRITPEGTEELVYRTYRAAFYQIFELPDEIEALLNEGLPTYQPAGPYGTPVPAGFDPTGLPLKLHSIPGDSFEMPSFWYGDLYAGDYLLGRVDFGGIPGGGWSTCSPAGDKLAFQYQSFGGSYASNRLRWLNLHDVNVVYAPVENLNIIGFHAWSPQGDRLAFFGLNEEDGTRGLYLLHTADNSIKFLTDTGVSSWPVIWKQDGTQLAFVDTITEEHTLYVIDTQNGSLIHKSIFDTDTWQISPESPAADWDISIPREYTGNCYAEFD